MNLGDAVASVATPIARALHMDCIDPSTQQLRPESPCNQRRDALNHFGDAMYDMFWPTKKKDDSGT